MKDEAPNVYLPFFQVKIAGLVVDHTNSRENAHMTMRSTYVRPAELWKIELGGHAVLLDRLDGVR